MKTHDATKQQYHFCSLISAPYEIVLTCQTGDLIFRTHEIDNMVQYDEKGGF